MRLSLQLLSDTNRQIHKYAKYVKKHGPVPKGFKVASAATGVKKNGALDLAVILNTHEPAAGASAAAVFTTNKFQAAPVQLSKQILEKTKGFGINAVTINSGCANAVTGSTGMCDAITTADLVNNYIGKSDSTLLMSTGVIGQALQMDKITTGINGIFLGDSSLGSSYEHWLTLATAIMTTDTFPKIVSDMFYLSDGSKYTMIGVAKGAGMICPNMATMLAFIGTDLPICPSALRSMLCYASDRSFNCITVDGDMSTNDTLYMMANGAVNTGVITEESADYELIRDQITQFATRLAQLIVRDGEGATKFVKVHVKNARNFADAKIIAKTISNSTLVKCALYGQDANWGRILSAIGSAELTDLASIEPKSLCVSLLPNKQEDTPLTLLNKGEPDFSFDEERAAALLKETDINVEVDLGTGTESCEFYTCDLSHEYVSINGHYRS